MNKLEKIELAYEQSCERLSSQLTAALAADSRAVRFAGVMIASAAVLLGLAEDPNTASARLVGSLFLIFSATVAYYTSRPVSFWMPGRKFSDFEEEFDSKLERSELLAELGSMNDRDSERNDAILAKNARRMQWAFVLAAAGICSATLPHAINLIDLMRELLGSLSGSNQ